MGTVPRRNPRLGETDGVSERTRPPRWSVDRRAIAAVGVLLLVLVVVALAARGADWTTRGPTAWHAPPPAHPVVLPTPTATATPTDPSSNLPPSQTSGRVVLVILGLLAVCLLVLLMQAVQRLRSLLRRPAPAAPLAALDERTLAEAADRALVEVEQPDAREAVVRAWLLLGAAAAEAGVPAHPAETATEYAGRIATAFAVPVPELHRLAELYREARFSSHPVEERQRAEARELLQQLRAGLQGARA
jgi:Domain of unknown function (DUF4129)